MDTSNILRWLEGVPFFANFKPKELEDLASRQNLFFKFEENQRIIEEGDTDQALYIILRGSVLITKTMPDKEVTLTKLNQGAVFGEMSLLRLGKRTSNAVADTSTILMGIKLDALEGMDFKLQVKFKDQLLKVVLKRFETVNNKYTELLNRSVDS
jgi:CRP/FNR family transcriptional regulator, cyclic AMP receptor protein